MAACPPCTRIGGPTWTLDLDGPGQRSEEGQRSGWGKAGVHSTRERAHDKRGPGSPASSMLHGGPWSGSSRPRTGESRWMPTRRCRMRTWNSRWWRTARGSGSKTRFRTLKTFTVSEMGNRTKPLPRKPATSRSANLRKCRRSHVPRSLQVPGDSRRPTATSAVLSPCISRAARRLPSGGGRQSGHWSRASPCSSSSAYSRRSSHSQRLWPPIRSAVP